MKMRSIKKIFAAVILLGATTLFVLAGCGGSSSVSESYLAVSSENNASIVVNANNADSESSGSIEGFVVDEGEQVVVKAGFNDDGKLKISLSGPDKTESSVSGKDTIKFTIKPGTYTVDVSAETTLTGSASIYTEPVSASE